MLLTIIKGNWYRGTSGKSEQVRAQKHLQGKIKFLGNITIEVEHHYIRVGRKKEVNDIILDATGVSREQCILERSRMGGPWLIADLKSTLGTRVRRGKLVVKIEEGFFPLERGDEILFDNENTILRIG